MPSAKTLVAALLAMGLAAAPVTPSFAAGARHHHHRHSGHRDHRQSRQSYASSPGPGTTCRTAEGTPYDPDIIGGANHVGDGGPAVNLGTGLGNPCSAFYLGGPGLAGPR